MSHESHDPVEQSVRVRQFPDYAAFQGQAVQCQCGWRGIGRQSERGRLYDLGVEVLCPACTRRLGVALFPAPPADERPGPSRVVSARRQVASPALARMLGLFESMTVAEHERAFLLYASGLPLTREAWIDAYHCGHDARSLPPQLEAHLPRAFARR